MAKKSSNPADAFRKAQRAKELKKNKEERKKVREVQTVKRDTRELESDIRYLKTQTDATSKARLTELESELAYVNKTKEAYVAEHPEARDRVFHTRKPREGESSHGTSREEAQKHLYDENGRLRDPKKSIYYDAVYNPFGVPPPGMPYRERTPEQQDEEESDEDEDNEEESDDDIVMPEGPPPTGQEEEEDNSNEDSDDSDDIPLPDGPPPPKPQLPPPPPPSMPMPPPMRMGFNQPPPPHPGMIYGASSIPGMGFRPPLPRPVAVPLRAHSQGYGGAGAGPSNFRPPPRSHIQHNRPPPMVQDPLSDAPTQTYQGHKIAQHALPARPLSSNTTNEGTAPTSSSTAEPVPSPQARGPEVGAISAAPVLRDLRKEVTAFVPRGVKKRKGPGGNGIINAAPGSGEIDDEGDERKRVSAGNSGLMGKLQGVLGDRPKVESRPTTGGGGGSADDDYQKFLDGLGDLS